MHPKTDQKYIQIDDKDYDMIYYHCQQTDEQVLRESNDLLPEYRVRKRYSSLFTSIVALLLGISFLSILTFVYNKYTFGINISNAFTDSLWNKFALNDNNHEILLSPFEKAVTVETECGKMIGIVEENAFAFKGIPYALPPIASLRWSRPIPLDKNHNQCQNNHNYYHANHFSQQCLQYNSSINEIVGNENCLFLNVWTPRIDDSANLNVMLYVHGSLEEGSGHQPLRPSGHLARKLNTIFVSINYRLNAFGFLTLDLLANSNANSSHGNYGLWDVIEGIHWIKNNIAAFGGDSKKLTVFGPDGDLILSLISNYEYSSLIQNAWILESRFLNRKSFAQQSKISRKNFLSKTNCSTVDCLKNLSGNEVLDIFRLNQIRAENISFIVSDDEIVFSTPNDERSETSLLVDITSRKDTVFRLLSNITSPIYTYIIKSISICDKNQTNLWSKSGQLSEFFSAIDQTFTNNYSSFGDELQKFILNFINSRYIANDLMNTTTITSFKIA